jgi:hypothetical protein
MVQRRDTSLDKKRGRAPATLGNYSSRLKIGRRESRTSRRFAPGQRGTPLQMAARKELFVRMSCAQAEKVDVVKAQGYFP